MSEDRPVSPQTRRDDTIVDLDASEIDDLRRRVEDLQDDLTEARAVIGRMQLQLDLFTSTDPLTGFVNRTGTLEAVQAGLDRLDRMGETFAVMAVRIPVLAAVRDQAPDEAHGVLRHCGALLAGGLRRLDRVGRLDGDVFVMVLANIGEEGIGVVHERVRAAFAAGAIETDLGTIEAAPRLASVLVLSPGVHDADHLLDEVTNLLDATSDDDVIRAV